jgi:diguanylate cyclase (GGDEF)-like protein/PAS domain S-box-containing protein
VAARAVAVRALRYPLIVSGLLSLLALLLLANYGHEVETRQRYIGNSLESAITSRLSSYQRLLQALYDNLFNRPEVAVLLARALEGDEQERARLRDRLYREFYLTFKHLQGNDFRELQFVLADGRSFLRFNRPDLYDDPIAQQRPLLKRALQGEAQKGVLEIGRVYPGFRFAFPLRYGERLVGVVDFCLSFKAVHQALNSIKGQQHSHTQYLVRKELFESVNQPGSDSLFRQAELSEDFLVERGEADGAEPSAVIEWQYEVLSSDPLVQQIMREGGRLNLVQCRGFGDCHMAILHPVQDSLDRPAGYIYSSMPMPDIELLRRFHLSAFLVGALLIILSAGAVRRWLDSTHRLRTISDHMAEGMYVMDEAGKIIYVNPMACEILCYDAATLIGAEAHRLFHAHDEVHPPASQFCPIRLQALSGEVYRSFEEHFRRRDGVIIRVSVVSSPFWTDGTPSGSVVLFRDITAEYEDKVRLQRSDVAFSSLAEAVMVTGPHGEIQAVNRAFTQITGYSETEVTGQTPRVLKSGRHDADFYEQLWLSISQQGSWEGMIWNRRKNGEIYPEHLRIAAVKRSDGLTTGYVGTFSDITEKLQQEQALRNLAYNDPLTGLHNRAAFLETFDHALGHARRHGRRLALLYLDLDRFKKINDTLGHVIGDKLLEASAGRLRESVRSNDEVARLGGDEFIIMLEDLSDEDTPARVARKVISVLGQPIMIEHHVLHMTTSIGIAVYPNDGEDATSLLKNADSAMYMAKREGRNGFHYFTQAMAQREEDRFTLEIDLHTALLNEEFLLHYQPKIDLQTGKFTGMEALLRWQHPQRGLLLPSEFLAVAHDAGVMRTITHWVITESCRQLQEWLDAGLEPGRIAINIDSHTLNSADAYDQIARTVEVSGISPRRVELEITESGLLERRSDDEFWKLMVELGFKFTIDDFGIGESSLLRLKHLPLTTLKIAKSFVRDIDSDESDRAIIRTVVAMGQSLGVRVLADGVERESQLAFLCQAGCDEAQGHLFSAPLAAEQVAALLAECHFNLIKTGCKSATAAF